MAVKWVLGGVVGVLVVAALVVVGTLTATSAGLPAGTTLHHAPGIIDEALKHAIQEVVKNAMNDALNQEMKEVRSSVNDLKTTMSHLLGAMNDAKSTMENLTHSQSAQRIFDQELRDILNGNWKSVDLAPLDAIAKRTRTERPAGHSGELIAERQLYYRLAQMSHVNRICEIGFNTGHSASLWLFANPTAEVVMFEVRNNDTQVKHGENFLRGPKAVQFGLKNVNQRLRMVFGDSGITVRGVARLEPSLKCDLLSIDGFHEYFHALSDIVDMHSLANPDRHVAVIDDTNCFGDSVDKSLEEAQRRGLVKVLLGMSEPGLKELAEYMAKGSGEDPHPFRGVTLYQYS